MSQRFTYNIFANFLIIAALIALGMVAPAMLPSAGICLWAQEERPQEPEARADQPAEAEPEEGEEGRIYFAPLPPKPEEVRIEILEEGEVEAPTLREDEGVPETPLGYVDTAFIETDLRQALRDMGAQAQVRIIPDPTVQGMITIDLPMVPIEDALRLVLLPSGYIFVKIGNPIIIALEPEQTTEPVEGEEGSSDEAEAATLPEPLGEGTYGCYLVTSADPRNPNFLRVSEPRIIELQYITPMQASTLIPPIYNAYLQAAEDDRRISVLAPPDLLDKIEACIRAIDQPPVQVLIEALVIESTSEAIQRAGLAFTAAHVAVDVGQGLLTYTKAAQEVAGSLSALMTDDASRLRASPRVVAMDGEEAEIEVGTEEYYSLLTSTTGYYGYARLEKVKATMKLTFRPYVNLETREVTVEIQPDISDVAGKGAQGYPVVTVRRVRTKVRVHDGQVIAIGGLRHDQVHRAESKIPILCELPIIGFLFRSVRTEREQREVIILIVPHILDENGQFEGQLLGDLIATPEQNESTLPREPEAED